MYFFVFSWHSFPKRVANFVTKFVEKLLNGNKWYQRSYHIFNTWKKEVVLLKWRNIYLSFLFFPQSFTSSQIWVRGNTFYKYYFSNKLFSNYTRRNRYSFHSLTQVNVYILYFTTTMVLSAHLKNLFQVFLRLSKGTSWKRYIIGMIPNNSL